MSFVLLVVVERVSVHRLLIVTSLPHATNNHESRNTIIRKSMKFCSHLANDTLSRAGDAMSKGKSKMIESPASKPQTQHQGGASQTRGEGTITLCARLRDGA